MIKRELIFLIIKLTGYRYKPKKAEVNNSCFKLVKLCVYLLMD